MPNIVKVSRKILFKRTVESRFHNHFYKNNIIIVLLISKALQVQLTRVVIFIKLFLPENIIIIRLSL